jgi:hypothetical protein
MDWRVVVAGYRAVFAALTLAAIAYQAYALAIQNALDAGNFFSFFTIQSNLFAAALFLAGAARRRAARSPTWDFLRGAAVVFMVTTGVVFFLLLRDVSVDTQSSWVNTVVHELMPVVVAADWLIDPPGDHLPLSRGLLWLCYPTAWIVYTLIRGALGGWYPYPFVNPANGGYATVALWCVAIALFMAAVCAVVVTVGNALAGRRPSLGIREDRPA